MSFRSALSLQFLLDHSDKAGNGNAWYEWHPDLDNSAAGAIFYRCQAADSSICLSAPRSRLRRLFVIKLITFGSDPVVSGVLFW